MTITEALAELKTLQKRLASKREYVALFLARQDGVKDPLSKDLEGGSVEMIKRERQAIADLELRHVAIRTGIQRINQTTPITIGDTTKTIAEWLTWRKEIAPGQQAFVTKIRQTLQQVRTQAQQKGWGVVAVNNAPQAPTDFIVNIDETALAKESEDLDTILGTLDGQLSLKNATVMIEV